jgi:hypothetical protein
MTKICIVTSGQPSNNPRVVKEADALSAVGYDVVVVGMEGARWAVESDKTLLKGKKWTFEAVGGHIKGISPVYWFSRWQYAVTRRLFEKYPETIKPTGVLGRAVHLLIAKAKQTKADLYIGHNIPGWLAASEASKINKSIYALDIEDYYSGLETNPKIIPLVKKIESELLVKATYVSVSSQEIADLYAEHIASVPTVLVRNTFPRNQGAKPVWETRTSPLKLYWFSQSIGPNRGLEDIFGAMSYLTDLPVELHLRGSPQYSQAYLQELVSRHFISPLKIHFLPLVSTIENEYMTQAYPIGLALENTKIPARDCCLTNKMFSFLSAGCAILYTKTTAQQNLFNAHPNCGLGYTPGNFGELAEHIRYWFHNREALHQARINSWHVGQELCWENEQINLLDEVECHIYIRQGSELRFFP